MMQHIHDAIVRGRKLVISDLPFAEGQRVHIVVAEAQSAKTASIHDIRRLLKSGVEHFENPFESLIPLETERLGVPFDRMVTAARLEMYGHA
jgi:hypothetical protein